MMNLFRITLFLFVSLVHGSTLKNKCNCIDRITRTIGFIAIEGVELHSEILSGYNEAIKAAKVQAKRYIVTKDEMRNQFRLDASLAIQQKMQQAKNDGVDGIITTLPDFEFLKNDLLELKQKGIAVTTIGPGFQQMNSSTGDNGASSTLLHIGMDEIKAGTDAGKSLAEEGAIEVVCIHDRSNKESSIIRCNALEEGLKARCKASACKVHHFTPEDDTDIEGQGVRIKEDILAKDDSTNKKINGVAAMQGVFLRKGIELLKEHGITIVHGGSFTTDETSLEMISNDEIYFAQDNQVYLNSYLATIVTSMSVFHGLKPAQPLLVTGPKTISELSNTNNRKSLKDLNLQVAIHGREEDEFWRDFKLGVVKAADSLGLPFFDCVQDSSTCDESDSNTDLKGIYYRSPGDAFFLSKVVSEISAGANTNPDGMIVSIPSKTRLETLIEEISGRHPVVSVNVGIDLVDQLGLKMHVGQDEIIAGELAGKRFGALDIKTAICLNQEKNNDALDNRCEGFKKGLTDAIGENVTVIDIQVALGNADSIYSKIRSALEANPEIQGILTLGPSTIETTVQVLNDLAQTDSITIGSFDVLADSVQALQDDTIDFIISQQQQLQAYMSTISLAILLSTGQAITDKIFYTGPLLVTKADYNVLRCQSSPFCPPDKTKSCAFEPYKGDGWCDEENNNPECEYDGGDCCLGEVGGEPSCKDGDHYRCKEDFFNTNVNNGSVCKDLKYACVDDKNSEFCFLLEKRLSDGQVTAIQVLGFTTLSFHTGMLLVMFYFRNSRVIFFANLRLMICMIVGAMMVTSQAILATQFHTRDICAMRVSLFNLGFTLTFACMGVKLYRMVKVFDNKRLLLVKFSWRKVVTIILSLLSVVGLVLVVWYVFIPEDPNETPEEYNECNISEYDEAFLVVLLIFQGGIMLVNAYFVHRLEKVVPSGFKIFAKDVKACSRAVFHVLTVGFVIVVLAISLSGILNRRSWLLLESFTSIYFSIFVVTVISIPKWILNLKQPNRQFVNSTSAVDTGKGRIERTRSMTARMRLSRSRANSTPKLALDSTRHIPKVESMQENEVSNHDDPIAKLNLRLQRKVSELQTTEAGIRVLTHDIKSETVRRDELQGTVASLKAEILFQSTRLHRDLSI